MGRIVTEIHGRKKAQKTQREQSAFPFFLLRFLCPFAAIIEDSWSQKGAKNAKRAKCFSILLVALFVPFCGDH